MYSAFMQYNEVFVTGGTGLLGRHVCRALIGHGFLPRLLVRTGSEGKIDSDVRERCRVTPGDLTVREGVEMGAQGTSAIVHLAGVWKEQPRRGITFEKAHVQATANVLHAASVWGIGRLIFVGVAGARPGDPVPFLDARGRAEALVRGTDRSWTVFRPAPWYDLRDGKPRVSTEYLEGLAGAIAESVHRQDTVGRVYEAASTDRFPWEERSGARR
ncbi:MAG: NAD(P)H-binding protein [Deltaproteobacteria bacterium]|nr:NAD(P)H-binding protein [Deltaproteobacteria bacterium]